MSTEQKPLHRINKSFIIKLLISLVAYAYIYYRISDFIVQTEYYGLIKSWDYNKNILLIVCVILMMFNWLIESIKWKKLLSQLVKISLKKSIKSVFIGITCAIFTPYRLGEYFGRPMLIAKEKKAQAVLATIMGSISQNIVTISMGIIGFSLLAYFHNQHFFSRTSVIFIFLSLSTLFILLLICFFRPNLPLRALKKIGIFEKWYFKLEFLSKYNFSQLLVILFFSISRYIIFFTQYYLLIKVFGIEINIINAFIAISLSYLFLFSIPGFPIADIGIRGSLALFFLGMFSSNDIAIVAASISLWIINLAIPSIIGSIYLIRAREKKRK